MTMAPASLVERARSLRDQIGLIGQYEATANEEKGLETRRGQLSPKSALFRELASQYDRCVRLGALIDLPMDTISKLRADTEKWRREFRADANRFVTDQQNSAFLYEYLTPLDSLSNALREQLTSAWQATLVNKIPTLRPGLLAVLFKIPALEEPIRKLNAVHERFTAAAGRLPQNDEDVDEALKLSHQLTDGWTSLPTSDIDDRVYAFLQAAASPQGASLEDLPEAEDWLRARGLLGGLRVKFG